MDGDDVLYLSVLIVAVICGPYVRKIKCIKSKQWISTAIGFAIVALVSGKDAIYPVLCTVINALIIFCVDKRYCHNISFMFSFLFLAFFRTASVFGLPEPTPHLNAIVMILTLKIVGLAFEVRDTNINVPSDSSSTFSPSMYTNVHPSFMDIFHYSFCYIGFLAGPYYKFRTYWDWLTMPYSSSVDTIPFTWKRITYVPLYAVLFLIGNSIYPQDYIETDLYNCSYLYRWWYMTPLFFNFRMRMYIGFILSECACIAAGLGMYPAVAQAKPGQGPTNYAALHSLQQNEQQSLSNLEYDFETVYNVNEYGSEFVPTMREGMKCWNMTVQYWLAVFVYKRVRKFRVAITMLVSAIWHGMYAGYYFCLLSVPLQLLAESSMDKALRRGATPQGHMIYDWVCWIFKMQAFAYLGMGFYLLNMESIFKFWYSMYFFGHILMIAFYCLGQVIYRNTRRPRTAAS